MLVYYINSEIIISNNIWLCSKLCEKFIRSTKCEVLLGRGQLPAPVWFTANTRRHFIIYGVTDREHLRRGRICLVKIQRYLQYSTRAPLNVRRAVGRFETPFITLSITAFKIKYLTAIDVCYLEFDFYWSRPLNSQNFPEYNFSKSIEIALNVLWLNAASDIFIFLFSIYAALSRLQKTR